MITKIKLPLIDTIKDKEELKNSMTEETKTPVATETEAKSETDNKGETPKPEEKKEVTPSEDNNSEETENEPFDLESMRKTFNKLRDEVKTLKKDKETVELTLKEKEEQEAASRGEYKSIAEKKTDELRLAQAALDEGNRKYETDITDLKKQYDAQEKTIHKLVNKLSESWPDEAKEMIDKEGQATAAERLKQFEKAAPFIKSFVEKTQKSAVAAPGLFPSPRDVREQGGDDTADAKANIRSAIRKGRIVNI